MNDLNTLLERAAGPVAAAPVDIRGDLSRGHRALARIRRRRGAAGLVGVAAAGVVGVGIARFTDPGGDVAADKTPTHHLLKGTGITFLAQPFAAGPYTFDQTPQGWEVQGAYPQGVTIAPVGFADQDPLSFVGKLVIMFDGNPPFGDRVDLNGRNFWVSDDGGGGAITISTRTEDGEPVGMVRIQYPAGAGWTEDTMLEFLAGVHVGPDAQPGLG
jgi:hypothetical protein